MSRMGHHLQRKPIFLPICFPYGKLRSEGEAGFRLSGNGVSVQSLELPEKRNPGHPLR